MNKWDLLVGVVLAITGSQIAVAYLDSFWGYVIGYAIGATTTFIQASREEEKK